MLNPTDLGAKGESRFMEICAEASIICNKSDRDLAGWDFILDFDFDEQSDLSLDKRIAPTSCRVQVKTVYEKTKSVSLKLNMAERLAKEIKPAFIFVAKVDESNNFTESYLIHVLNSRLAKILKRLRQESIAQDKKQINKQNISFTPQPEELIGLNGAALLAAIRNACGNNLHEYSLMKQEQLKRLGYKERPFECSVRFNLRKDEDIADVFFGLRQNVELLNFESYENRFDIKIPHHPPTTGTMTIQAEPADHCKITFRGNDGLPPAVFQADLFVLPRALAIAQDSVRMYIKSELFGIQIKKSESHSLNLTFSFNIIGKNESTKGWWNYWRMMRIFAKNNGRCEIASPTTSNSIDINIQQASHVSHQSYYGSQIKLCDRLENIFKHGGVRLDEKLEWEQIEEVASKIFLIDSFIQGSATKFEFANADNKQIETIESKRIIVADMFYIGQISIVYYCLGDLKVEHLEDKTMITVLNFSFRMAKQVTWSDDEYNSFLDEIKIKEGIDTVASITGMPVHAVES